MGRTDAILIVAFDFSQSKIGLFSIPRDLWVHPSDLAFGRINTVVRVGDRELGPGQGLMRLRDVIKKEFGIHINYTITADFEGFINIVDFLDGIPVEVACPIEDCFHLKDADTGCEPLSLAAGRHYLDGNTALKFARSRHGRTDIDRARRQQAVLAGLKKRLTRPQILLKLPALWNKLNQYVHTDLSPVAALKIGMLIAQTKPRATHGLILKPPIVEAAIRENGKQVLILNRDKARAAISTLFSSPRPGKKRHGTICPAADVGLHWRERLEKKGTSTKTN